MPGSQRRHEEVCQFESNGARDFVMVQQYMLPGFNTMKRELICCQAGDLVLWDSRTIHCNTPAPKPAAPRKPNAGGTAQLLRGVAYVCMTPRRMASAEVQEGRKRAYETRTTTSHWPHELHLGLPGTSKAQPALDYNKCDPTRRALI